MMDWASWSARRVSVRKLVSVMGPALIERHRKTGAKRHLALPGRCSEPRQGRHVPHALPAHCRRPCTAQRRSARAPRRPSPGHGPAARSVPDHQPPGPVGITTRSARLGDGTRVLRGVRCAVENVHIKGRRLAERRLDVGKRFNPDFRGEPIRRPSRSPFEAGTLLNIEVGDLDARATGGDFARQKPGEGGFPNAPPSGTQRR